MNHKNISHLNWKSNRVSLEWTELSGSSIEQFEIRTGKKTWTSEIWQKRLSKSKYTDHPKEDWNSRTDTTITWQADSFEMKPICKKTENWRLCVTTELRLHKVKCLPEINTWNCHMGQREMIFQTHESNYIWFNISKFKQSRSTQWMRWLTTFQKT